MNEIPIAKFFVVQKGWLKNSQRILIVYPSCLRLYEFSMKSSSEIQYNDIVEIKVEGKKLDSSEFLIRYKKKGKIQEKTLSTRDRNGLLTILYLYQGKNTEKRFNVTKWTKNNTRVDYILSVRGVSLVKIDVATQKDISSFDLVDIDNIYKVKVYKKIYDNYYY